MPPFYHLQGTPGSPSMSRNSLYGSFENASNVYAFNIYTKALALEERGRALHDSNQIMKYRTEGDLTDVTKASERTRQVVDESTTHLTATRATTARGYGLDSELFERSGCPQQRAWANSDASTSKS